MPRRSPGEGQVFFSEAKGVWIFRAPVGFHPDGRVRHIEGRGKSRADAVAKLKAVERTQQGQSPTLTVAAYLVRWLADVAKPNVRDTTHLRYEQIVRKHITPKLGGQKLARLTAAHCTAFFAELFRAGVTPGNIRKISEVLATALEHAVNEGLIPTAPTRSAVKPRVDHKPIEVFTDEEVKRLLTVARPHRLYPMLAMAVGTGMRQGELFALQWADVAADGSTVHVRRTLTGRGHGVVSGSPKSRQGYRVLTLPAFVRSAMPARGEDAALVFPNTDGTGPVLRQNFMWEVWRLWLGKAKVKYRVFHALRHTAASRLLAEGVDVPETARILGDRPETVLKVYAHWIPGRGQAAADKMDGIYGERGGNVADD